MKLLFDENLSWRLVGLLGAEYPDSSHVDEQGLSGQPDSAIWTLARSDGFVIVSKDNDFRQLSFLRGAPPKVVWLSVGNASTARIAALLRAQAGVLDRFDMDSDASLLVLTIETADDEVDHSPS